MGEEAFPRTLDEALALVSERGRAAPRTAVLLYFIIREAGEGGISPYEAARRLRELYREIGRRPPSYANVLNMFYVLRRLGLIELAATVPASRPWLIPMNLYRISERGERERHMWLNPKRYYAAGGAVGAPRPPAAPAPPAAPPAPPAAGAGEGERREVGRRRERGGRRAAARRSWTDYLESLESMTSVEEWSEGLRPGLRVDPLGIVSRVADLMWRAYEEGDEERAMLYDELIERLADALEGDEEAVALLKRQMREAGMLYAEQVGARDLVAIVVGQRMG